MSEWPSINGNITALGDNVLKEFAPSPPTGSDQVLLWLAAFFYWNIFAMIGLLKENHE